MSDFEQKLCDALNNIAKAIEHVSSSLDEIEAEFGMKTMETDMRGVENALVLVARAIEGRDK